MRNTNKNAFFLFYFNNGVPWTARSKVKISETPKKWENNFVRFLAHPRCSLEFAFIN